MRATSVRRERSESESYGYGDAPSSPRRGMGKRRPSLNLFSRQGSGRNLGDKQGSGRNLNASDSPPDAVPLTPTGGSRRRPSLNLFSRQGSGRNLGQDSGDSIAVSLTKATKGALKSTAKATSGVVKSTAHQIRKGISRGDDDNKKQLLGSDSEEENDDNLRKKSRKPVKKDRSMSMDNFGLGDESPKQQQQPKRSISALRQTTIEVDERFGGKGRSGPAKQESSKRSAQDDEDCYKPVERVDWKFNAYYHGDSESWRVGGAKKKSSTPQKPNFKAKPAYSTEEMKPDSSDESSTSSSDDSDSSSSSQSDAEMAPKKKEVRDARKSTTQEESADDKLDRKYAAASASAVSVGGQSSNSSNYGRMSRIRKRTSINNAATNTQEDEDVVQKSNSADSSTSKLPPLTRRGRAAGQLDGSSAHNRRALSAQRHSRNNGMDTSGHSTRSHSTTRSTRSALSSGNSGSVSPVKSSSQSPVKRPVERLDFSKTEKTSSAPESPSDDDKKRRSRRNREDRDKKGSNLQSPVTEDEEKRLRSNQKSKNSSVSGEDDYVPRKIGSSFQSPSSEDGNANDRPRNKYSSSKGDPEDKQAKAPPRTRDNKVDRLIRTNSESSFADARSKFERPTKPDVVLIGQSPVKQRKEESKQSIREVSAPPMTRETRSRKPTRTFSESDATPSSDSRKDRDERKSSSFVENSNPSNDSSPKNGDVERSTSSMRRRASLDFGGQKNSDDDTGRSTSRLRRRGSLDFMFGRNKNEEPENDENETNEDGMLAMVNTSRHTTSTSDSSYGGSEMREHSTRGRRRGSLLGAIGSVFTSTSQDDPVEEEKAFEEYDDGRIRPNFPGHDIFSYFLPEEEPIVWVDMVEGGKSRKDKKKKRSQDDEEAIQYPELNVFVAARNNAFSSNYKKEPYMPVGPIRESLVAVSAGLRRK